MSALSRRGLLAAALASLAAPGEASPLFRNLDSALAVGRLRLAQGPLDPALPPLGRAAAGARIRADFAAGRVLRLDGWVLSRTEAELCARAALLLGESPAA